MARSRLTRSELKAQDEITTKLKSFTEVALARKKDILMGAVAVVVLVVAFLGYRWYSNSQHAAAQKELAAVIAAFNNLALPDNERFERTVGAAQKVIADYGSTQPAALAGCYLALSQEGLGDKTNSIKTLEELIGRADPSVKPFAQFTLASIYRRRGDFQKTTDILKQLEQSGGYSRSAVAYELGAVAESSQQTEQAKTYYSKVITDSPDSPFRGEAEAALKRMGLPVPAPAPGQTP